MAMANEKWSALYAASPATLPLAGTDIFCVTQGADSAGLTAQELADSLLLLSSGTFSFATVGTNGQYPTIADAFLDEKYNVIIISDVTETQDFTIPSIVISIQVLCFSNFKVDYNSFSPYLISGGNSFKMFVISGGAHEPKTTTGNVWFTDALANMSKFQISNCTIDFSSSDDGANVLNFQPSDPAFYLTKSKVESSVFIFGTYTSGNTQCTIAETIFDGITLQASGQKTGIDAKGTSTFFNVKMSGDWASSTSTTQGAIVDALRIDGLNFGSSSFPAIIAKSLSNITEGVGNGGKVYVEQALLNADLRSGVAVELTADNVLLEQCYLASLTDRTSTNTMRVNNSIINNTTFNTTEILGLYSFSNCYFPSSVALTNASGVIFSFSGGTSFDQFVTIARKNVLFNGVVFNAVGVNSVLFNLGSTGCVAVGCSSRNAIVNNEPTIAAQIVGNTVKT